MAEIITEFDTGHSGAIHDCELDYYGKKLATTSSDHTIRLWDISSNQNAFGNVNNMYTTANTGCTPVQLAELKAHEGPVWQVSWAHPKFGGIIASCSYDKRVIIWREVRQNEWQIVRRCEDHAASVNTLAWASWEYGLQLACGSSDGYISVLSYKPEANVWTKKSFQAHPNGVNAVSWCPPSGGGNSNVTGGGGGNVGRMGGGSTAGGSAATGGSVGAQKIVSGGSDNQLRIWRLDEVSGEWVEVYRLEDRGGHSDWVRDVAWRPNVGLASNYIASCSEDQTVIIWYQESDNMQWKNIQTINMHAPVWRVSWSVTGNVLAVASGDSNVSLFKEGVDGKFETVTFLGNGGNNVNEHFNNSSETTNVHPNEPTEEHLNAAASASNASQQQAKMVANSVTVGGGDGGGGGGVNAMGVMQGGGDMHPTGRAVSAAPPQSVSGNHSPSRGSIGGSSGGIGAGGMSGPPPPVAPANPFSAAPSNAASPSVLMNGVNPSLVPRGISGASTPQPMQQPYMGGGAGASGGGGSMLGGGPPVGGGMMGGVGGAGGMPQYRGGVGNIDGSAPPRG